MKSQKSQDFKQYGLDREGNQVTFLATGKTYDLDSKRYSWLKDYLTDPASLSFILGGMSKD